MSLQHAVQPVTRTLPVDRQDGGQRLVPLERPERRRRPRVAYAVIALAGAALIGLAQMALSLVITQDSYTLAQLRSEQRELSFQQQALEDDVAGLNSPQYLAESAAALGMVVAGSPAQLRLSDGAVLGAVEGAPNSSTVSPVGNNAVANALLLQTLQEDSATAAETATNDEEAATAEEAAPPVAQQEEPVAPSLPPAITEGLPSPTTH